MTARGLGADRRTSGKGDAPPLALRQRCGALLAGEDGPTLVVPTLPVARVRGASTAEPNGRLLGDCGMEDADPAGSVDTGAAFDS